MTEKVIELADQLIGSHETYREAKIACEKLFIEVVHEIELRAMERSTRGWVRARRTFKKMAREREDVSRRTRREVECFSNNNTLDWIGPVVDSKNSNTSKISSSF